MVVYTLEQRWKWACDRRTEDADFGKKNHLFRWSSLWSWRVCKQAKLSPFGAQKTRTHTLKSRHTQNESLWCGFWHRGIIGSFFFENEQGEAVTVNGDCYRTMLNEFLFTKIKKEAKIDWQHLLSTGRRYVPHSRSYTRCFTACLWISHYQPQSWYRLGTTELRFDTVGLLFVWCRQR